MKKPVCTAVIVDVACFPPHAKMTLIKCDEAFVLCYRTPCIAPNKCLPSSYCVMDLCVKGLGYSASCGFSKYLYNDPEPIYFHIKSVLLCMKKCLTTNPIVQTEFEGALAVAFSWDTRGFIEGTL